MPIKDIRNQMLPKRAFAATINSATTTTGDIIDTADFTAICFTNICTTYGAGTYTPVLNESDASDLSGSNTVDPSKMIGSLAGAVITAANTAAQNLSSFGAFGTKRYVRLDWVSTVSPSTTAIASVFQGATEVSPNAGLSA